MRRSLSKSLIAVCVAIVASVQAHAQPLFGHAESIESTVINADNVVVGKIVEFEETEAADERGGHAAMIAVEETLKGEHRQRLRVRLLHPPSVLQWKNSPRLLVARLANPPAEAKVIDLADKKMQVLSADFTLLETPEDVIRIAKETVRRLPGVKQIETFRLTVPREPIAGTKWESYYMTGGYVTLSVPVDQRLEKRAHDYINSNIYHRREEAARALRYFKSDENIARVRALLDDPGWAFLHHAQENRGIEVRLYGVRKTAFETLLYWGISAEKPLIREEVEKRKQRPDLNIRD